MNITKETIDDLNAVVKVKVGPADYTEKVDKAIRNYQKKAAIPGFRQGKVPVGLVKKMYGKSILADELNRILSDSLYKFIQENKIDVLGNPLPKEENNDIDIENQSEFEFKFDMAVAPQFDIRIDSSLKFDEYVVKVDDKLIDGYVSDMARRYGKIEQAESIDAGDLVHGDFVELDAAGEILSGGIFHASTLFLDNPVKEGHKAMVGAKTGDKFILETKDIADSKRDLAQKLGIDESKAADLNSRFQFTVKTISRLIPAELNTDLFDKVYGPGVVTDAAGFRDKIAEELRSMFARDAEKRLRDDISGELLNKTNLDLPDAFLKRWLVQANEKPVTPEQVEAEYPMYARQLRWQLIENKIIRDNKIEVTADDAKEHVKNILKQNFAKYGRNPDEVSENELNDTAQRVLGKEEEAKKVFEDLYAERILALYRSKCTIQPKEVSYEEFLGR